MTSGAPTDRDVAQLIAEFEASDLRELHVRRDGFELYLSKDSGAAGPVSAAFSDDSVAATPIPAAPSQPAAAAPLDVPPGGVVVRAPYLGTFYRAPKPGAAPYVELGQTVAAETEICLVEVMKLFTAVRADTAGVIHAVLAKDGDMVQADAPLFVIRPA